MDHSHHHRHLHRELAKRKPQDESETIYSVVYVTASPTFTGVIGGYTTLTGDASTTQETSSSSAVALTAPTAVSSATQSSDSAETSAAASADQSSASVSSILESSAGQSYTFTSDVQATSNPSTLQTQLTATTSSASASKTSNALVSSGYSASTSASVSGSVSGSDSDSALGSDSGSSSGSSSGMSGGAKAGIAIGVLALVGLLAVVLLWLLGKKRKEREAIERANNEKPGFTVTGPTGADTTASPPTTTDAVAPRLSLRPMSRMMDGFLGGNTARSRNLPNGAAEEGRAPGHANGGPSPVMTQTAALQEKQPVENPFADPQNPFQDPAPAAAAVGTAVSPIAPGSTPTVSLSVAAPSPSQPALSDNKPTATKTVTPEPAGAKVEGLGIASTTKTTANNFQLPPAAAPAPLESNVAKTLTAAGVAGAIGVAAAAATAAAAHNGSSSAKSSDSLPAQKQASPELAREKAASPTADPTSTPAAPASVTGALPSPSVSANPEAPAGGNVYRVLMDFSPSMEDELELKTGQLIRLLHEYDDGWALCIRLDRSQQGVVPRTCLAAKPSKPKPSHLNQYARGPGPQGRPMSPAGVPRPMSPAGVPRPMSPAGVPRPMSPAGVNGRPASPGMGRPMSPSMSRPMSPGMGRPMSPSVGRPIASRPVPGRPMSPSNPGAFNQAPRPLSPGPRPYKRSQSPGPYGVNGPAPMHDVQQRRRSNSASALGARDRRTSPLGPSNLGPAGRPVAQPHRPMSPGIAL